MAQYSPKWTSPAMRNPPFSHTQAKTRDISAWKYAQPPSCWRREVVLRSASSLNFVNSRLFSVLRLEMHRYTGRVHGLITVDTVAKYVVLPATIRTSRKRAKKADVLHISSTTNHCCRVSEEDMTRHVSTEIPSGSADEMAPCHEQVKIPPLTAFSPSSTPKGDELLQEAKQRLKTNKVRPVVPPKGHVVTVRVVGSAQ